MGTRNVSVVVEEPVAASIKGVHLTDDPSSGRTLRVEYSIVVGGVREHRYHDVAVTSLTPAQRQTILDVRAIGLALVVAKEGPFV